MECRVSLIKRTRIPSIRSLETRKNFQYNAVVKSLMKSNGLCLCLPLSMLNPVAGIDMSIWLHYRINHPTKHVSYWAGRLDDGCVNLTRRTYRVIGGHPVLRSWRLVELVAFQYRRQTTICDKKSSVQNS